MHHAEGDTRWYLSPVVRMYALSWTIVPPSRCPYGGAHQPCQQTAQPAHVSLIPPDIRSGCPKDDAASLMTCGYAAGFYRLNLKPQPNFQNVRRITE